jgi:uncharacterized protein (TIRG00374 family)
VVASAISPTEPVVAPRRRTAKTIRRTVAVFVVLFIIIQFGLPQINGTRRAVDDLSSVNPFLLILGLALEAAALVAYAQLTRTALPQRTIRLTRLFRIQLATKALGNVVPGGSAAGSALGYRLLTASGVKGSDAGFALATAGLGSAVVLNLLLWVTMLISIPLAGWNPIYVTVAMGGVFILLAMAGLMVALIKGQGAAERVVRWAGRHFRFIKAERVMELLQRLAKRLVDLISDRELLVRVLLWSLANWLLDAAALWVFLRAFGGSVRPDSLIVAFGVANVAAALPIMPGGLLIVEGLLATMLAFFGVERAVWSLGIPAYRVAQYWLPIPLGAIAYLSLRVGPFRLEKRLPGFREEMESYGQSSESVYDWAERFGHRSRSEHHPGDVVNDAVEPPPR